MADTKLPTGASTPAPRAAVTSASSEADAGPNSDIDPELLSLRGPRPRVGVLLSLSIVLLCVYLMSRIVPDLRFALQDGEPLAIADASEFAGVAAERYVEMSALALDRAAALRVSQSADPGLATGQRVAPARGTGGALWVAVHGNPRQASLRPDETHTGRLRQLADVPFAGDLKAHAKRVGAPRFATATALREALTAGANEVAEPAGEPIPTTAATAIAVAETVAGQAEITTVATEEYPSAERWAEVLADVGALSSIRPPVAAGDGIWVWAATGDAHALNAIMADAGVIGANAEQATQLHELTFGQLEATGEALRAGDAQIPWPSIDGVWIESAIPVADGAKLLLAGEQPSDYRHVPWLFGGLAGFALLFTWALVDGLRRERAAHRATTGARDLPEPAQTCPNPPRPDRQRP